MGLVAIEGMAFHAFHGYYEEERLLGNDFVVDVYIRTHFGSAAAEDELGGTINYETIYQICKIVMKKPVNLLETLSESIASALKFQFAGIQYLKVRVRKLHPPVGGTVASSFVETEESFEKKCGKCGSPLLCYNDDNCWCREVAIPPRTLEAMAKQYSNCLCKKCLSGYVG